MNYTINQLRIFLKVVETRSVTKASEELYMTQPAVSIQLKNFQDQFDFPLTEVIGRKLFVTDFGLEVARNVDSIMREMDELKFKTKEYYGKLSGQLKISAVSTGKYLIPFFLTDFLKQNDGVDLKLDVTNKSLVIQSLKNNEVDFALVSVLPDNLELEQEILMDNRLYFVANGADNANETLIYREKGSATRQEMEHYFDDSKGEKRKKLELSTNEAVKQALIAGLGSSVLPLIGIKNELIDGSLKIIEKPGLPITTQWRLIWLKEKKLSPITKAYLDFIGSNKEAILQEHFAWYSNY